VLLSVSLISSIFLFIISFAFILPFFLLISSVSGLAFLFLSIFVPLGFFVYFSRICLFCHKFVPFVFLSSFPSFLFCFLSPYLFISILPLGLAPVFACLLHSMYFIYSFFLSFFSRLSLFLLVAVSAWLCNLFFFILYSLYYQFLLDFLFFHYLFICLYTSFLLPFLQKVIYLRFPDMTAEARKIAGRLDLYADRELTNTMRVWPMSNLLCSQGINSVPKVNEKWVCITTGV
jgi:hypothetical protein